MQIAAYLNRRTISRINHISLNLTGSKFFQNCSTNDDFGSTQLHEEVNRRYRLVMEADSQNSQADGTEEREKSEAGPARTVRRESARTENSSSKENSELQPRGVMPPLLGNMLRMTQRISNKTDEAPRSLTKRL